LKTLKSSQKEPSQDTSDKKSENAKDPIDTNQKFLRAFPSNSPWKEKYLLTELSKSPNLIRWDDRGVVSFVSKDPADGSSITDLVRYVISPIKWNTVPVGVNTFLFILKLMNIPTSIFTTTLRNEFNKNDQPRPKRKRESYSRMKNISGYIKEWEPLHLSDQSLRRHSTEDFSTTYLSSEEQ
jgi:hypothetical protein